MNEWMNVRRGEIIVSWMGLVLSVVGGEKKSDKKWRGWCISGANGSKNSPSNGIQDIQHSVLIVLLHLYLFFHLHSIQLVHSRIWLRHDATVNCHFFFFQHEKKTIFFEKTTHFFVVSLCFYSSSSFSSTSFPSFFLVFVSRFLTNWWIITLYHRHFQSRQLFHRN